MDDGALKKLVEIVERTEDFCIEQAPAIVKEFFEFERATAILGICLCVFLMSVSISVVCFSFKKAKDEDDGDVFYHDGWTLVFGLSNIPVLLSFVFLCINIYNLVMLNIAPKWYIIKHLIGK